MMSRSSSWFLHTFNENALQVLSSDGGATFDQPVMGLFHDANEWMAVFFHHFLVKFPLLLQENNQVKHYSQRCSFAHPETPPNQFMPLFFGFVEIMFRLLVLLFLVIVIVLLLLLALVFPFCMLWKPSTIKMKVLKVPCIQICEVELWFAAGNPRALCLMWGTNLVDCIPEVNESLWSLTAASKREPWPWCHQHDFVMIFQ